MGRDYQPRLSSDDSDWSEGGSSLSSSNSSLSSNSDSSASRDSHHRRGKLRRLVSRAGHILGHALDIIERKIGTANKIAGNVGGIYGAYDLYREKRGDRVHKRDQEQRDLRLRDLEVEYQIARHQHESQNNYVDHLFTREKLSPASKQYLQHQDRNNPNAQFRDNRYYDNSTRIKVQQDPPRYESDESPEPRYQESPAGVQRLRDANGHDNGNRRLFPTAQQPFEFKARSRINQTFRTPEKRCTGGGNGSRRETWSQITNRRPTSDRRTSMWQRSGDVSHPSARHRKNRRDFKIKTRPSRRRRSKWR